MREIGWRAQRISNKPFIIINLALALIRFLTARMRQSGIYSSHEKQAEMQASRLSGHRIRGVAQGALHRAAPAKYACLIRAFSGCIRVRAWPDGDCRVRREQGLGRGRRRAGRGSIPVCVFFSHEGHDPHFPFIFLFRARTAARDIDPPGHRARDA